MRARSVRLGMLPLLLAAGLSACASNAVPAGVVYTSSAAPPASGAYGGPPTGSSGPYTAPAAPAQGSAYGASPVGQAGRVVSINEVSLQGSGGGGSGGNGPLLGGLIGAAGGATVGAITSQSLGGGIVGALIGLVGGAIAGTIASGNYGSGTYGGRGIEVTVQRDDGQQVTVAQRDDGDIQLGDRVQVVQNSRGVAQVVRDTSRNPD